MAAALSPSLLRTTDQHSKRWWHKGKLSTLVPTRHSSAKGLATSTGALRIGIAELEAAADERVAVCVFDVSEEQKHAFETQIELNRGICSIAPLPLPLPHSPAGPFRGGHYCAGAHALRLRLRCGPRAWHGTCS